MIDTTLASDNFVHFRKDFLERVRKLSMARDDKIRNEKLLYNIKKNYEKLTF